MSLSEKLSDANPTQKQTFCKVGNLFRGDALSKKDREHLELVLNTPTTDPRRITNADICRLLREEGINVSDSSMDRHRRKDCSCYRKAAN